MQGGQVVVSNEECSAFNVLHQTSLGELDDGAVASQHSLESLFIYQHTANTERLRSLHIHFVDGALQALLQDLLLSPGGYCLLRGPEKKFLASQSEATLYVTLQSRTFLCQGWRSLLDFSVNLQLPPPLCPLLSPTKNPLLPALATLYPDLCFVEAVIAKAQQEGLVSIAPGMSEAASTSGRNSGHPPATPASQSFPTCRGFKVPPLDIPITEPEAFSLRGGHAFQLSKNTWGDAPPPKRSLLSGAFLPEISRSGGGESSGWEQSILSALTQAAASCVSSPPNPSPALSLETPSPQFEMPHNTGGLFTSGLPHSTVNLPSPSQGFSIPHPPSALSLGETCPKPPKPSVARSLRNSAGIAVPASYQSEPHGQASRDPPALSLPPAPLSHSLFQGAAKLSLSYPPPGVSAAEQLSAWSSRGATSSENTAMLTSGACTPQPARWPTREFASLVSKWSAATSPLESTHLERVNHNPGQIDVDPDTKFATSEGYPSLERSQAFAAVNSPYDIKAALPTSVQNLPSSGPLTWGALSQLVNSLASPINQVSNPLATNSVRTGEPLPTLPASFPQTLPGLAIPATPTPFGLPDPIGTAFAALEQGLVRRSAGDVSRGLADGSPTSSSTSSMDELRAALSLGPSVSAGLSPGTGFGSENGSSKSERIRQLSRDEIARHFDMPISEASKRLGVGLTVLKKRCRDMGIHRWPHRKLKSMNALIQTVQQLGAKDNGGPEQQIGSAIQRLEAERNSIEAAPSVKLTHETRKFRQACFKAKYKLRNLAAARAKP
ncbi:RWP-RK domain-containing protein [Klebsormidium nitens]|uniref:RWP-RK domain-containing protein n=1 Tax=Klebsormidium nitens TaxID=105231 RepID=A0A1Y1I9S6_KLENI|nr:RWP-RK domain-containing protein [Klebsormidium nitens]|eukprot:GAQ87313.1 RWP-RK domain-containing protein [Klebsormidium nitens]